METGTGTSAWEKEMSYRPSRAASERRGGLFCKERMWANDMGQSRGRDEWNFKHRLSGFANEIVASTSTSRTRLDSEDSLLTRPIYLQIRHCFPSTSLDGVLNAAFVNEGVNGLVQNLRLQRFVAVMSRRVTKQLWYRFPSRMLLML